MANSVAAFEARGGSVVINGQTITITIPQSDVQQYAMAGRKGYLYFLTKSTAQANSTVSNTATITHYVNGQPEVEDVEDSFEMPDWYVYVDGIPKGTIEVHKVVKDTTNPIAGVHFRVYKVDASHNRINNWYNGADYAEIVSGTDGVASIANLQDGTYEFARNPR